MKQSATRPDRMPKSTKSSRPSARPNPPSRPPRARTAPKGQRRAMDDRFSSRRMEAERQAGARRLRIVAALSALSTLFIMAIGFVNSSWFAVDEVLVVGSERSNSLDIIEASAISVGLGLLDVDAEAASRRVEQVPWVGTADVRRSWNGRVEIAIVERGPVAALPAPGGYAMVDHWGRQLEVVEAPGEGFIAISGVQASGVPGELAPAESAQVIHLVQALVPSVERQIDVISLIDNQVVVDLAVGGQARFGDATDIELKVQSLETLLERVDLQCLAMIDVSVPSAPSVRRIDENTSADVRLGDDGEQPVGDSSENDGEQEPNAAINDC